MAVKQRSPLRQIVAGLAVVVALLVVVIVGRPSNSAPASAAATRPTPLPVSVRQPGHVVASMFQDDDHLIYASTATVAQTLDTLRGLGVNQIRATIEWKLIAPNASARTAPQGFDGTNPANYPASLWAPYDRLVSLARARGMTVNFNVTAPGPLWAMSGGAPSAKYADHWAPSSADFGQFVQALGTRYSGHYLPAGAHAALPRVSFWSIWNEPNQPGWLAPQWRVQGQAATMESPALYRGYVDAGFAALARTGHQPSTDTILVGDLAPEGCVAGARTCAGGAYQRPEWPIPPLPFLRAVYCVGPSLQPLSGSAATAVGCPGTPDPRAFEAAHPGLFQATGFAQHPYSFALAPNVPLSSPDYVPLANLNRLEHSLDAIFKSYGVARQLPIYLTEYGYETNPPNPYKGVSPDRQAEYLNEAQYMAWADPRVATLNQFLLYDSPPNRTFPKGSFGYWSTFQTGLLYANGTSKPSLDAYRLPIFLPRPTLGPGHRMLVWAMLRAAPPHTSQQAEIQWQAAGSGSAFRTLQTVSADQANEVVRSFVHVPGAGLVRVRWTSPSGQVEYSRTAGVSAG